MTNPDTLYDDEEPMVVRMARVFAEREVQGATDIDGNPIKWENLGALRQRHLISCMQEVLFQMRIPTRYMTDSDMLYGGVAERQWIRLCDVARNQKFLLLKDLDAAATEQREAIRKIVNDN